MSDDPSRVTEFKSKLDALRNKRPQTTLQIIEKDQQERHWQRLLFHFLSPHKRHELEYTLLEHLLNALSKRDDIKGSIPLHNPDNIQIKIETAVETRDDVDESTTRRVDAVIWSEQNWFICWELKVEGSEEDNQTRDYVNAESFPEIELDKNDVPDDGHHYIYLAEENAQDPEAEEFVSISWSWIASQITSFLKESSRHSTRSTVRLLEFCETIWDESNLSEYQKEGIELYIEYFDVVDSLKKNNEYTEKITELEVAFNKLHQHLDPWRSRLVEAMDSVEPVKALPTEPDDVAMELDHPSVGGEQWVLHQHPRWGGMFKRGWWRHDDGSNIYTKDENGNNVRITFSHNLPDMKRGWIENRELKIPLYHGNGNKGQFKKRFNEILKRKVAKSDTPSSVSVGGGRSYQAMTVTSDIPRRNGDDFLEEFVAAWSSIIDDILIDNHEIISLIDDAYEQSLNEVY